MGSAVRLRQSVEIGAIGLHTDVDDDADHRHDQRAERPHVRHQPVGAGAHVRVAAVRDEEDEQTLDEPEQLPAEEDPEVEVGV